MVEVVNNTRNNVNIWFAISHQWWEGRDGESYLEELENKGYELKNPYTGGENTSKAYLIEK